MSVPLRVSVNPAATLTPTLSRLQRYVLRARVELRPGPLSCLGISGPSALSMVAARLGAAPERVDAVVQGGPLTALRLPGGVPRCLDSTHPATILASIGPKRHLLRRIRRSK